MSNIKLAMAVAACLLLYSLSMALAASQPQADENTRLHIMQATSTGAGSAPQLQVPGMGASQQYDGIQSSQSQPYDGVMSSTSEQQLASSAVGVGSNYDWLSPGGVSGVRYYGWGYPYTHYGYNPYGYYGYYPATTYRYYWDSPGYYNDFDPWWVANVYGPFRTTYYWYSW